MAHSLVGPLKPHAARSPLDLKEHARPKSLFRTGGAMLCVTLILVENTGLEPVTSWMQTKRSPS